MLEFVRDTLGGDGTFIITTPDHGIIPNPAQNRRKNPEECPGILRDVLVRGNGVNVFVRYSFVRERDSTFITGPRDKGQS